MAAITTTRNQTRITDLHSHFLPGIDDGCKNCKESVTLLFNSLQQGIYQMAATPHYYPTESVASFLERRREAYEKLMRYAKALDLVLPQIILGAEVAYRMGIAREPELPRLCYGKSRYILIEMPFKAWPTHVLDEVEEMILVRGLKPVIAHLERYDKYQDKKTLQRLFDMNVLIQMNAEHYLDEESRRRAVKSLKKGQIQVIGSDAHNNTGRPQNLGEAIQGLYGSGLEKEANEILSINRRIFEAGVAKV